MRIFGCVARKGLSDRIRGDRILEVAAKCGAAECFESTRHGCDSDDHGPCYWLKMARATEQEGKIGQLAQKLQTSAWLRPRGACFRFARQDHCSSTTSIRLNFRLARRPTIIQLGGLLFCAEV